MADYRVKEVISRRDLRRFIKFPETLYAGCDQYVPPLHKGQEHELMHSASLKYCSRRMWIAEDVQGKVVGRICAMINPRYNQKYSTKRVRFGWFDLINDLEVARVLFEAAESWAKDEGMDEIHGPLYYNTLGRQGMLVEGFDKLAPFSCLYNYSYYVDIVQELGFQKECDWIQYMMPADHEIDDRLKKISARLMQRYNLRIADFDALKKDRDMVRRFFRTYNECFDGNVYNFVPFTEEEIEEEIDQIMSQLDKRLCCVIMDEDGDVAAFGISIPSLSRAMQKAKGRLLPLGWYHVMRAMNDFTSVDLMLEGAAPKWQNTGVSALVHEAMSEQYKICGAKWALANPQIETNTAVNVWSRYEHELWLRRRCWIKKIK